MQQFLKSYIIPAGFSEKLNLHTARGNFTSWEHNAFLFYSPCDTTKHISFLALLPRLSPATRREFDYCRKNPTRRPISLLGPDPESPPELAEP